MNPFIVSKPRRVDLIDFFVLNPETGQYIIPSITFDLDIVNPYFGEIDVLNEDIAYQNRVIEYFYTNLTEKWLFNSSAFRKLLKYFKVQKKEGKGTVSMVENLDNLSKPSEMDEIDRKFAFKYIEKHFITRRLIEEILKDYVTTTKIKWYDLFQNKDTIKELFSHKLKRLIVDTIYRFENK